MMKPSISSLTLLLLASGCATDLVASALSEVNLIDDTTSTGDDSSGSTWSGPVSTVTSATTSASSSSGDAGDTDGATSGIEDTTSGDADAPPMISKHELSPTPILFAGAIWRATSSPSRARRRPWRRRWSCLAAPACRRSQGTWPSTPGTSGRCRDAGGLRHG